MRPVRPSGFFFIRQANTCIGRWASPVPQSFARQRAACPLALRLALEVEPLLYDVKHFINTASILNRMSGQGPTEDDGSHPNPASTLRGPSIDQDRDHQPKMCGNNDPD